MGALFNKDWRIEVFFLEGYRYENIFQVQGKYFWMRKDFIWQSRFVLNTKGCFKIEIETNKSKTKLVKHVRRFAKVKKKGSVGMVELIIKHS